MSKIEKIKKDIKKKINVRYVVMVVISIPLVGGKLIFLNYKSSKPNIEVSGKVYLLTIWPRGNTMKTFDNKI